MPKPPKRWTPQTDEQMARIFPNWRRRDICKARGGHEDREPVQLVTKDTPRVCSDCGAKFYYAMQQVEIADSQPTRENVNR
jgi:hypothetical protein